MKKGGIVVKNTSAGDAVYGLGIIGAIIYFLQHATTFWLGAFGIIKALFWPAFLVYKALEVFKM